MLQLFVGMLSGGLIVYIAMKASQRENPFPYSDLYRQWIDRQKSLGWTITGGLTPDGVDFVFERFRDLLGIKRGLEQLQAAARMKNRGGFIR